MLVDINLLPEKEKERSSLLYAALAVLLVALLFWLIFFLLTRSVTQDTERLQEQIVRLEVTQSELSARLNHSETTESFTELEKSVQWAEEYRYATAPLLEDLVTQLPKRGFFRSFAFSSPHQATVEVQFDDKIEAAYYLTRMLASDSIETASVESIEAEQLETEEEKVDIGLPRYIATYTIFFVDPRATLDGVAPATPEDEEETEADDSNNEDVEPADDENEADEPSATEEEESDEESN